MLPPRADSPTMAAMHTIKGNSGNGSRDLRSGRNPGLGGALNLELDSGDHTYRFHDGSFHRLHGPCSLLERSSLAARRSQTCSKNLSVDRWCLIAMYILTEHLLAVGLIIRADALPLGL